jgi:ribonuclease P protein component
MFKKQNRLSKTKDVTAVSRSGRSFFSPNFVIKYVQSRASHRVTVVVSTKVSKSAVVRNRIKRVIREAIRLDLAGLKPGDYVIIVKPAVSTFKAALIREAVLGLLRKTRLL